MDIITINTSYIKLDQLLKYAGITQTGGHSKIIINEGLVKVNGEVCTQRGKKIESGDIISIEDSYQFKVE